MSTRKKARLGQSGRVQEQDFISRLIKQVIVHQQGRTSLGRLDYHFYDAGAPHVILVSDVHPRAHFDF